MRNIEISGNNIEVNVTTYGIYFNEQELDKLIREAAGDSGKFRASVTITINEIPSVLNVLGPGVNGAQSDSNASSDGNGGDTE